MPWYPVHPIIDGKKKCIRCGEVRLVSEFPRQRKNKDGIRSDCKICNYLKNSMYYQTNREVIAEKNRVTNRTEHRRAYARKYQATRTRRLRDKAAGRPRPLICEVCGRPDPVFDHNHGTKEFRGWPCNRCNRVIGMCGDSPALLRALAAYLEKYDAPRPDAD